MESSEQLLKNAEDYIESGEYFKDAKTWYRFRYIYPFSQRSFMLILFIIASILFCSVLFHIYGLFPLKTPVSYYIKSDDLSSKSAQVTRAEGISGDSLGSIADVLIRNYVKSRESYDYEKLKDQFTFIKNNSTRIVFRKFYNFMNIDNAESPVLKYQNNILRRVTIESVSYPAKSKAVVHFNSKSNARGGAMVENSDWNVNIQYEIDPIDLKLPHGSRFNFKITNYDLEFVGDKLKK